MAAKFFAMNFKIRHRATELTPPTVATQDLLAQARIRRVWPRAGVVMERSGHLHGSEKRYF
jgi:hypothetical protein